MNAESNPRGRDESALQDAMVQLSELISILESLGMSVAVAHLQAALDNCEADWDG